MNAPLPREFVVEHHPAASRSLRVAFVTETYPPEVNGVAMTVARVIEGLQRRHHDVQLVRPRQLDTERAADADAAGGVAADAASAALAADAGPRFHEVLMRGLPIPRYPHLRMGLPSQRQLVRLWSLQRPDVVHVATEGPLGWSAVQAARHLRLPVTSDFRTNFHAYSRHYGLGWLHKPILAYLRKFHNLTAATMVPTEPLRRELEAAGFQGVQVVARGVDTRRFAPAHRDASLRAQWGAGEDDLVIGCVGRLAPEKNLPLLLAACDAIRREQPGLRVVLVGDGPMQAELRAHGAGLVLTGRQTGASLAAHYASFDLFLFPSVTETFGNVTAEAMASGLPVLAYDYAAAAQLIRTGENGLLVPYGDGAAFVRTAVELARHRVLRQALGAQACRSVQAHDWDDVIGRFESVLLQAIDRHPPRVLVAAPRALTA